MLREVEGMPIISEKSLQALPLKYATRMEAMMGTLPEEVILTGPLSRPGIADPLAGIGSQGVIAFEDPADGHRDGGGGAADIPETQLGVEVEVVVPGEDIAVGQFGGGQTHHLGEAGPVTAIEVRHPHGSDDRDIAGGGHLDRTLVQPGIADAGAGIGSQGVIAFEDPADGHRDGGVGGADIPETQLRVEVEVVVPGEGVGGGQLADGQSHQFRVARPGRPAIRGICHPLRGDDRQGARHSYRSVVYTRITLSEAGLIRDR